MFVFYSSTFFLCLLMTTSNTEDILDQNFCLSKVDSVSKAFMIHSVLYFGDGTLFWELDVKKMRAEPTNTNLTLRRKHSDVFIDNPFNSVDSAVFFDKIRCEEREDSTDCADSKKAENYVLVFGTLKSKSDWFGYKSYKAQANANPTVEADKSRIPWGLLESGKMTDSFWPQNIANFSGITFEPQTQTLYLSFIIDDGNGRQYIVSNKNLDKYGVFSYTNYREAPKDFTALIDWEGKVYGLADNKFSELNFDGENVTEREGEQFTVKKFVNCDKSSPLLTITNTTTPSSNSSESDDKPINETTGETEDFGTTTSSPEKSSLNLIIIIAIILVIILIIILILIFFCCCGKKTNEGKEKSEEKERSKSASVVLSETGTKLPSKSDKSTKSTSKVGSNVGSKSGSSLSTKSNEYMGSVRSHQ